MKTFDSPDLDDGDRKLLGDIQQYGWHFLWIHADDDCPGWGFTIGLHSSYGHPELSMFGLTRESTHGVFSGMARRIQAGERYLPDRDYDDLLEGYPCRLLEVGKRWYPPLLGYARWFYESDAFPVSQCVWPDREGHFPWQPEFAAELVSLQPLLDQTEPHLARMTGILASLGED